MTRSEALATGAGTAVIDGLIGDAGAMVARAAAARDGWFDVSTLKEPYRVEGKKTMGLEIAEQLGWRAPDVVVYPTGGGVGLIGIAKAFAELRELGWLTGPATRFVAAQSSGCAPVVRAFEAGAETTEPWPEPRTVAYGITVAAPLGGAQLLRILRASGGTAVAVDDADALSTRAECAAAEGVLLSPEGAVALHAVRMLTAQGWVTPARPGRRAQHRQRADTAGDAARPRRAALPRRRAALTGPGPHSHRGRACCRPCRRDSRSLTPRGRSRSRTAAPPPGLENTLAAVDRVVALGFGYLETDVRVTRDGVAVLLHDARLDRTTDRTGLVRDAALGGGGRGQGRRPGAGAAAGRAARPRTRTCG